MCQTGYNKSKEMLKALFPTPAEQEVTLQYPADKLTEEEAIDCAEYEAEFCGKRVKTEHWLAANMIAELYLAAGCDFVNDPTYMKTIPTPASFANQNLQFMIPFEGKVFRVLYEVEFCTIDIIYDRHREKHEPQRYDVVGFDVLRLSKDYSQNLMAVTTTLIEGVRHIIDKNNDSGLISENATNEAACPAELPRGTKRSATAPMTSSFSVYKATQDDISTALRKRARRHITVIRNKNDDEGMDTATTQ